MKTIITALILLLTFTTFSQTLPYYQIPQAPQEYTAGTVTGRMIDGLGFRFFWATEELTKKDLVYKPNPESRSTQETVSHIYDLSMTLLRLTKTKVPQFDTKQEINFAMLRKQTLLNFKALSDLIKSTNDLSNFDNVEGKKKIKFWNLINGPIADAIWHTGQIASFRRSSGNPISSKINHFSGTVKK